MYVAAACQLSSSLTLIKATEGLQSRNEIAKISNSEVSIEQEVSKKRKKKKVIALFKNKSPVYYFLWGNFQFYFWSLHCFVLSFGGRILL